MNYPASHTLTEKSSQATFSSTSLERHPLVRAFRKVVYGDLTLTLDNERLEFHGSQPGPNAHLNIYDLRLLDEIVARGQMGLADGYIEGRWDSSDITAFITFSLLNISAFERFFYGHPWYAAWMHIRAWLHRNNVKGSARNVMAHYDLGNDFYSLWLDPGMTYSCGLFEGDETRSLEAAQQAKYQRILRKLNPSIDDHVLEIGCGWGGFAETAARAGLRVTGITLSEAQAAYAKERIARAGLADRVTIELIDYRKVEGLYNHVVSIGMFEHVGEQYWPTYFHTIRDRLKPGGRALIQTITLDDEIFEKNHHQTGFIDHYIFPGGMLPSRARFREHVYRAGLQCRETYSFGHDYVRTLQRWRTRFEANLTQIKAMGYDDAFIRLWRLYLCASMGAFLSHRTDVMQAEIMHA